jgi:HTH-type transcriptional regulator, competence development regulator
MPLLSPLGKTLRHLRLEEDERLLDMAERLSVTSSFLSAIEMGRKAPPRDFAERVVVAYKLPNTAAAKLRDASAASQQTFRIEAKTPLARHTAGMLASKFPALKDDQLSKIQEILRRGEVDD